MPYKNYNEMKSIKVQKNQMPTSILNSYLTIFSKNNFSYYDY